jgi:glucose/arabinose dehydrogenase
MKNLHKIVIVFATLMSFNIWEAGAKPWEHPGETFLVPPRDLPTPYATRSASNGPRVVRRAAGLRPTAPPGFQVDIFATGLAHARWLITAPTGEVFLAQSYTGEVTQLIDKDGDGQADDIRTLATGFDAPHGLALHNGHLYIADRERVWRVPWKSGTPLLGKKEAVTPSGSLGGGGGHWTRTLAFAPDRRRFYVAIGSRSNIAEEDAPRATIKQFNADGSNGQIYASGLRNPVGVAFHPDTGSLYTVVNERDGLGDNLVPDYLTAVRKGGFYGWPYAYIGPNPMPGYADQRPDLVAATMTPDVLFQSHSAPIGLAFITGAGFPAAWRGDALVALKGSWNAATPTGYKVVRVPFNNGEPVGGYENFVTGFRIETGAARSAPQRAAVFGRPAGLAIWGDRGLLIADPVSNTIWRIHKD